VTRPSFDLYTLRSIRGDALIRYNTLNQSEPLRINLYALATLSFFSYTAINEAVVGEPATLAGTVATAAGGCFALYRFVRECGRRSQKLVRMEKELNAELLAVRLPNGPFADRPYGGSPAVQLRSLKGKNRILAICGDRTQLAEALLSARVLRRRLAQASALVVAVPTDGSSAVDWGIGPEEIQAVPFLAEAVDYRGGENWVDYFRSLTGGGDGGAEEDGGSGLAWLGLTYTGKSFGSGKGSAPRLLEILGQTLLPLDALDEADEADRRSASSDATAAVLELQKKFYDALTGGDLEGLNALYSGTDNAPEVDEVLDEGGRVDAWEKCLEDGARPAGMTISGSDVLLVSDTEAWSTCIEFPPGAGFESGTLLAVQRWSRPAAAAGDAGWQLRLHQTIPWTPGSKAGGTLRCDRRGCTALAREQESRYNWRGMID